MNKTGQNRSVPNILLLTADDHRWSSQGRLGGEPVRTPNLDSLARRGTCLDQVRIPGSTSPAVCMPSRAMLYTGQDLFRLESGGASIPGHHRLLGEALREAGYHTHGIGKWHNGPEAFQRSFEAGAEILLQGMWDHWNIPLYHYHPDGVYQPALPYNPNPMHDSELHYHNGDHMVPGRHSTDIFTEAAINFLQSHQSSQPFFLSVAFMAPHDPRTAPLEYHERYDPEELSVPESFQAYPTVDTGMSRVRDEMLAALPRTPHEIRRHLADYYAMLEHLDHGVGRILNALEKSGKARETLVVYTADHGLALGKHGMMGKQSLFEHSIRVPMILAGPGIEQARVSTEPLWHYDLYATLLELAGVPVPSGTCSESFVDCLSDTPSADRNLERDFYFAFMDRVRALHRGDWKLIEYAGPDFRKTQLFHLAEDPEELHDLSGGESTREITAVLRLALEEAAARSGEFDQQEAEFWNYYRG